MKIKINLFRKIFMFSIFTVIFTVLTSYILNIFFLDNFLIYGKKHAILKIKELAKSKLDDEAAFEEFVENVKDHTGIDIVIMNEEFLKKYRDSYDDQSFGNNRNNENNGTDTSRNNNAKKNKPPRKIPKEYWETGKFHMTIIPNTNIQLLFYNENISNNSMLSLRTSISVIKAHKEEMNIFNIIATIISIFVSMILGRIFSKKITKNIEKLNYIARKISVLDFSEKSSIISEDEIGELSKSIDIMSDNLSSSIENLRNFASDASHELKTPITIIDTHAQGLIGGIAKDERERMKYYKAIAKKSREMNEIVGNLLTISRLSSPGIKLNLQENNFIEMLKDSIEKYENIELEKDIRWDIAIESSDTILCDTKLFKIALDNIIQNALKYSVEEEIIKIYKINNEYFFENFINGCLSEKVEKLWEPFSRGENATDIHVDGNGLGLSIVKKIIELNGFECKIEVRNKKFIFSFIKIN
ncbi:MAG: HAMP domain-containing histidine kinase [Fusobacteriaceae bacterium]|jgi:signal transduction histidine kinase|nr:HAMP domain-containing histidine kinase [Fusobacteriaceae bacterium]